MYRLCWHHMSFELFMNFYIYYKLILTTFQLNSSPFLCNALLFILPLYLKYFGSHVYYLKQYLAHSRYLICMCSVKGWKLIYNCWYGNIFLSSSDIPDLKLVMIHFKSCSSTEFLFIVLRDSFKNVEKWQESEMDLPEPSDSLSMNIWFQIHYTRPSFYLVTWFYSFLRVSKELNIQHPMWSLQCQEVDCAK